MNPAAEGPRPPLRLLLVTHDETIPTWLGRCLSELARCGIGEVVGVLRTAGGPKRHPGSFLYRVYKDVDRRLFPREPDALAPVRLQTALPECSERNDPEVDGPVDVVLDPDALLTPAVRTGPARHGVWTLRFGRADDPRTLSAPGYWEVVEGMPETETRLCVRLDGVDRVLPLLVSVAPTDRRSVARSQNHIFWKMAAALESTLRQLWADPEPFHHRFDAVTPVDAAPRPTPLPQNLQVLRGCTRLVRRYIADTWRDTRTRAQWALAYDLGGRLQTLLPPLDRFWADPFPVRVGNEYYVFYEEAPFSTGKGRLVAAVLDDTGRVLTQEIGRAHV